MRVARTFVAALAALSAASVSGCTWFTPRTVVKPETVEVTKYQREPLPPALLQAYIYVEPDPACWRDGHREFCNEQLLQMRLGYRQALSSCNDDKAALRAAGPAAGEQ
ncbi:MAG: hypothetical protein J0I77_09390 [Rudaea sp.]|uniref:hypothetical protein n=1 Tax=unclassified Rudaea TaxID=2627037 RepID=UPI0010F67FC8|nr:MULTISPECIES: hypothetical protein [unclassified Rudaea]MBN8885920.1 hypothetical protein [Rudaea sp.]MBR0346993.1 hypothetical protein [Rudaea sp.]